MNICCYYGYSTQSSSTRYFGAEVGDKELSQRVLENNFYCAMLLVGTTLPGPGELQKFAHKNCPEGLRTIE